jgi:hypothetical protein
MFLGWTVVSTVTRHWFDGAAASQLALDHAEDATLLAGDEEAAWIWRVVAAISFVDIGALDLAAGDPFGGFDDGAERVPVVGVAWEDRGLDAELVRRARLALADAFDLGSVA